MRPARVSGADAACPRPGPDCSERLAIAAGARQTNMHV
jgi:hypothetical protein